MNRKFNGIILLTTLLVALGSYSLETTCSNDELDFVMGNFFVYRNNISAVNLALKECSVMPPHLDQILFTILTEQLVGDIVLDIRDNIRYLTIDKMASENITITVPKKLSSILRIELKSEENWFHLCSTGNFFGRFPNLEYLKAEFVILCDIPSFSSLQFLTRVQVVNAQFMSGPDTTVNGSFISGLQNLEFLSWKESTIKSLAQDTFSGLPKLTELSLENNKIDMIRMNQFRNLTSLIELDLSHNNVTTFSVESGAFNGLVNLEILRINSNPFFSPNIVFHPLYNLQEIYIQNNEYTSLDFRAFQQKTNLRRVYLFGDNMFDCTCSQTEWMGNVSGRFEIEFLGGQCDTPAKVLGRDVTSVDYAGCPRVFSYDCFGDVGCTVAQICINTHDSFECNCPRGFANTTNPVTNRTECLDVNECLNLTSVCDQICENLEGTYTCSCRDGYTLEGRRTCNDIDECSQESESNCQQEGVVDNDLCENTDGSYNCTCRTGYELKAGNRTNCVDIDECASVNRCTQKCVNTPGDYTCECKAGFQFETATTNYTTTPTPMNTTTSPTPMNATSPTPMNSTNSTSTMDSTSPTNISDGTNNMMYGEGNKGVPCEDIDECSNGMSMCEHECINTVGSYNCSCYMGFNLTGRFSCSDIDECVLNTTLCDDAKGLRCNNTIGGYECVCKEGYEKQNTTCVQVAALTVEEIIGIGMAGVFVISFFFVVILILICCAVRRSRQRVKQKEEGRTGMLVSGISAEQPDEEVKKIEDNKKVNAKSIIPNEYELESVTKETKDNTYEVIGEVKKEEPVESTDLTASAEKRILEREFAGATDAGETDTGANNNEIAQEAEVTSSDENTMHRQVLI